MPFLLLVASLLLALGCSERPSEAMPPPRSDSATPEFVDWAHRYRVASPREAIALEAEGVRLARARKQLLRELAEHSPEVALAQRLSFSIYRDLPEPVREWLERPVDGIGELEVLCETAEDDGESPSDHEQRYVLFEGRRLRAAVYGKREAIGSKERLRIHGIIVDDLLVISDSAVRLLEPGEFRGDKPLAGASGCGDASEERLLDIGDQVVRVCNAEEAEALADGFSMGEQSAGPDGEVAASAWTVGPKSVLYIRVDFSDLVGEPVSAASAQSTVDTLVNTYYQNASYGLASVSATVTPVLRMPQTAQWYGSNNNSSQLLKDARAAANAAGFNYLDFDRDLTAFKKINDFSWAGLGYIGNRGAWLNGNFAMRVTAHELGHNNGLRHASRLDAADDTVVGAGTVVDYGHPWDIMGASSATGDFNAWFKSRLDWIPPSRVATITTSGTYRLHDLTQPLTSGFQALKIARDGTRAYWVEYRPVSGKWHATNGASINFGFNTNQASQLLDLTPHTIGTSTAGREDSPLVIGRTYSDPAADVHLTPIALPGTSPASLDVVVHVAPAKGGAPTLTIAASETTVAINVSVTLTATASDPDGDALAYSWDFDDGSNPGSGAQVSKSFSKSGDFNVRCTVSDMKGNVTTRTLLLTVGTGAGHVVSGRVLDGAQPLEGVRVTNGTRSTWTDSQGVYRLTQLSNSSPTITAIKPYFELVPSNFNNPLSVSGDVNDADFVATREGFTVSGKVTSAGSPVGGVTVSAGSYTAITNATGDYRFIGLPAGTYTFEATAESPRQFKVANFTNPVTVSGDLSGRNFNEILFSITGEVSGVFGSVTVTDGVRTTTSYLGTSGKWVYLIDNVPPGSWNLWATRSGYTLTPSFTNPVVVTTANKTAHNFTAAAGTTYLIRGRVMESGAGVGGVTISTGARSATTDSLGYYVLSGMTNGAYTLTPSLAPWRFSPMSRPVTVSSADLNEIDFVAVPPNQPPKIIQSAAPQTSPVLSTSVLLSVVAEDDAGEGDLAYQWQQVSGPATASLSRNGTNGAKETLATFPTIGTYQFEVTVTDLDGATATSIARVNVWPSLTAVIVSPDEVTLRVTETQRFTASAVDQFGAPYPSDAWTWSVEGGGTVDGEGLFVASEMGGPFILTASLQDQSATAAVTVLGDGIPKFLEQAHVSQNPVKGLAAQLGVLADDDGGESNLTYAWRVSSGGAATFAINDSNAAKQTGVTFPAVGMYALTVRVTDQDGDFAESELSLQVVSVLAAVSVSPASTTTPSGVAVRFEAAATDQFGAPLSPQPTFKWTTDAGATANHGYFISHTPGRYDVHVESGGFTATASVEVLAKPAVDEPIPDPPAERSGGGCGCATGGAAGQTTWAFAGMLALALFGSRRRAEQPRGQ